MAAFGSYQATEGLHDTLHAVYGKTVEALFGAVEILERELATLSDA